MTVSVSKMMFLRSIMCFTNEEPTIRNIKKDEFLSTIVKGASIGANATICVATTLELLFCGSWCNCCGRVADFALVAGTPAKQIGWMSQQGARLTKP